MRTITHPEDIGNDDEDSFIQNEEEADHSLVNKYIEPLPPSPSLSHKIDNSTKLTSDEDCPENPDCRVTLKEDSSLLSEHTYPKSIEPNKATQTEQRQLSTDDTMSTGSVPIQMYQTYLKMVKNPLLLVVAFASYWASNSVQVSHFLLTCSLEFS